MRVSPRWFLLLGVPLLHPPSSSGLKFSIRHTHEGISSDQTLYIEQDRRRTEYRNATRDMGRSLLPLFVATWGRCLS